VRDAISFPALRGVPGLVHAVTTRAGGASRGPFAALNLGLRTGDDPAVVGANRRLLAAALGAPGEPVFPRQVHGARVAVLEDGDPGEADGIATARAGVAVGVLGADCPGVLLVDPARRALAVVHAGWRGTLAGAVPAAVATLRARFGADAARVRAGIGPGISAPRYEVGPEVADAFRAGSPDADACLSPGRGDRAHLDLRAAIRLQLLACGVPPASIETLDACTYDDGDLFFSHRRDGERTGRHAVAAMWRDGR
jgi:YfiH family protein